MTVKCISANVYRAGYGDCTNNGISKRFDEILLPVPDGYIDVDLNDPPDNYCEIEIREMFGKLTLRIVPYYLWKAGKWVMMGGNFAYSSDARFREYCSDQPIAIHDRVED